MLFHISWNMRASRYARAGADARISIKMPAMMDTMITTNIHRPRRSLWLATRAMELPARMPISAENPTTHRMNTATVAIHTLTKSMYTGFQRPRSAPTWALSTKRLLKLYSVRITHSTDSTRPSSTKPPMEGVKRGMGCFLPSSSMASSAWARSGDSSCRP